MSAAYVAPPSSRERYASDTTASAAPIANVIRVPIRATAIGASVAPAIAVIPIGTKRCPSRSRSSRARSAAPARGGRTSR